jgi:hypothetical protein
MPHPATVLALTFSVFSPSLGGIVVFDPPDLVPAPGDTQAVFDLTLVAEISDTILVAEVLIGSDDADFTFGYSAEFEAAMSFVAPIGTHPIYPPGVIYPYGVFVGGNSLQGVYSPLLLGTITVDLDYYTPEQTWTFRVDAEPPVLICDPGPCPPLSILTGETGVEPLSGLGVVVSEPATIVLLAVGFLVLRRRKVAA